MPNSPNLYDKASFDSMRAFRRPFIVSHLHAYYALLVIAVLHVAGVVITEIRAGSANLSATLTGRKILLETPVDSPEASAA